MLYPTLDFLHLLATAAWIGGMIYIILVLMPSLTAIDPPQRGKLMGAAAKPGEPPSPEFLKTQKQLPVFAITNTILGIAVLLFVALLKR
jgi:hypothetical protein